jgi:hypothetical protein
MYFLAGGVGVRGQQQDECRVNREGGEDLAPGYRPVDARSPMGLVLRALACLAVAGRAARPVDTSRGTAARDFVAARWGKSPELHLRFRDRQYVQAAALMLGAVVAFPGVLVYGIGLSAGTEVITVIGGTAVIASAIPMGVWLGTFGRFAATTFDYFRWRQAGEPLDWRISPRSQYRDADLLWCGAFAVGSGWLAWKMLFG